MGLRTFLALELPPDLRADIARNTRRVKNACQGLAWSRAENLHINVKFFGETNEEQVEPIRRAVEESIFGIPPFVLELKGLGAFPDTRSPRVLWVGIDGDIETLATLAERVGHAVVPLGFPREDRPFRPHLTLARVKKDSRAIGRELTALGTFTDPFPCGPLSVERLALFASELRPGGAVYVKLWDLALTG